MAGVLLMRAPSMTFTECWTEKHCVHMNVGKSWIETVNCIIIIIVHGLNSAKNDAVRKDISRGAEWCKFQLRSTLQ